MTYVPGPLQTLFLWRLLVSGEGEFWKRIKPSIDARDRKQLEEAGLIVVEKRREPNPRKGAVPIMFVALSEKGWDWASRHLDQEISTRSTAAGPILQTLLGKLKAHLARNQVALAEFICPPPTEAHDDHRPADIPAEIRAAYFAITGGRPRSRVRLADLRLRLPQLARESLDAGLLAMEREQAIVLYPMDDPQEIKTDDRDAALPNSIGIPRHVMYIER